MNDPEQKQSQDEEETTERKPELASETLKDLTPPPGGEEDVKGGQTGDGTQWGGETCNATM